MPTIGDLENTTYRRLGILLILVGLLCAVGSSLGLPVVFKLWPLLVLGLGVGFIGIFAGRRARGAFYLALGEYLVLFSGLALYLNFTSWRSLSHLWPAFIAFLGVVFATLLFFRRKNRFLLFLALLFVLVSASLFLIFSFGNQYWWSILVLVGLSVLVLGTGK
jgi:hypothetical protein